MFDSANIGPPEPDIVSLALNLPPTGRLVHCIAALSGAVFVVLGLATRRAVIMNFATVLRRPVWRQIASIAPVCLYCLMSPAPVFSFIPLHSVGAAYVAIGFYFLIPLSAIILLNVEFFGPRRLPYFIPPTAMLPLWAVVSYYLWVVVLNNLRRT